MAQETMYEVSLVAGEKLRVLTQAEKRWYENARKKYLAQTRFDQHTDRVDLDRLMFLELMVFRWTQWLAAGQDYYGAVTEDDQLRKNIKEQSAEITRVKTAMGLTKEARNKVLDNGNFAEAWELLRRRAKQFGIHREDQLRKALVLMNELSAIVGTFDRSDGEERKKAGFESEAAIVDWVRTQMLPQYHAIDEHFRANEQRMWTREAM